MLEEAPAAKRGGSLQDPFVATLDAACRDLVSEHKNILACREANLRHEIERLQQELSAARPDNDTDEAKAKIGNNDAMTIGEGSSPLDSYPSCTSRSHSDWLGSENNRGGAVPWGKVATVQSADSPARTLSLPSMGAASTDHGLGSANGSGLGRTSSMVAMMQFGPDGGSEDDGSLTGTAEGGARQVTPSGGEAKRVSARPMGKRSILSAGSSSSPETRASWMRAADTVILKASSDFLSDGHNSIDFRKNALVWRFRQDRTFRMRIVESIMGFVIVLNTMTLGMSSELEPEWVGWLVVDCIFAGIFTLELFFKFSILGMKGYCWGVDWRWNDFEFVLVVLAWIEVGSLASAPHNAAAGSSKSSLFRMLRLMRLAKLLRVMRLQIFCDLLMMVNGAIGSSKTLLYSGVLIFIPLYGVALVLKETLGVYADKGNGAEVFKHLEEAFFTMFRCIVGGDCNREDGKPIFVLVTRAYGWVFGLVYCLVQFLMTFGLFNVIVAIYVENTVSAAKFNDTYVKRQRLQDREYFENKAQELLKITWRYYWEVHKLDDMVDLDEDTANKLQLTQAFFEQLCRLSEFTDLLRRLDISEDDQLDLFETLDVEGTGSIYLTDFVIGIGKLRGEARKADVIAVNLLLRSVQHKLFQMESRLPAQGRRSKRSSQSHLDNDEYCLSSTDTIQCCRARRQKLPAEEDEGVDCRSL